MRTITIAAAVAVAASLAVAGQPQETRPAAPPASEPSKPTSPPAPPSSPAPAAPPAPMPSLDEALGLSKPSDKPKPPANAKPALPGDLEKALTDEQGGAAGGNELQRAVALMERAATRLEKDNDTSIDTQRTQEETVRLLDTLVKKSGQKKPSNKPQQNKPDQNQQQQQPNQSQQSQASKQPSPGAEPSENPDRGGTRDAQLRPGIEAARAAWGNLPQRIRQLLVQGSGDQFSKEYQRLTEEYYKRLGEQGN